MKRFSAGSYPAGDLWDADASRYPSLLFLGARKKTVGPKKANLIQIDKVQGFVRITAVPKSLPVTSQKRGRAKGRHRLRTEWGAGSLKTNHIAVMMAPVRAGRVVRATADSQRRDSSSDTCGASCVIRSLPGAGGTCRNVSSTRTPSSKGCKESLFTKDLRQ